MNLTSHSPDETEQAGYRLGKALKGGDIVCFFGELGSGKTTMIKGIAGALGIDGRDITSASFTIVAEYHQGMYPLKHIDLYRLEHAPDIEDAGIWESLGHDTVSVIEWAERLGNILPSSVIRVTMQDKGDRVREITIEGIDEEDRDYL